MPTFDKPSSPTLHHFQFLLKEQEPLALPGPQAYHWTTEKYNSDKLEMVQRRAAHFVKGMYRMFESVTEMLEQLTWIQLSKRRQYSHLILFHKIINNLAVVPHSCLEKADVGTRKNHSQ